ncbi:MAG: NAD(P)/FAD-dependent oxidoreductase [Calditrichaeota bacterium]|nr:NAD(P)/FAD-dependent oxidoreductase [Calditrichota bacterium]
MSNTDRTIHIVGAGPAGLVAAINLAKAGFNPIVHEQHEDVGKRFNGDFQGLENWTTEEDVTEFLDSIGIEINFRCVPYFGGDFYGPNLKKIPIKTQKPLFYLIERGVNEGSFDQGLKQQALKAGVKISWNDKLETTPPGKVIVGTGPKAADAIAKGIVFKTSHPDMCVGFVDNRIAPRAYAYLLVNNGSATFATCLFEDFKNEKMYFEKALQTMQKVVDIEISQPKEFGGFANFYLNPFVTKNGRILYVGENAGFQDALWGFGIRYALMSGFLAAQSIITGKSYDELCKQHIHPFLKVSLANRMIFAHLGNRGYQWLLNKFSRVKDARLILQRHNKYSLLKKTLFLIAYRWYRTRLIDKQCMHQNCNCVWCRCGKEVSKSL